MNQLIAVAFGGAIGAALRYLVSNGIYQWLGRGFPYGTLTVNVLGSFLIGLMTEALLLQRVAISLEYRAAVLVGVFGSFTTFSTFSLETVYLIEQGNFLKATTNVLTSVFACIFAVWIGLLLGRTLFMYSGGVVRWMGWVFPYALVFVNAIGAFIIGIVSTILMHKIDVSLEHRAALVIIMVGTFITLSSLYLILYLIESGHSFENHLSAMLGTFMSNVVVCGLTLWLGLLAGKQI